MTFLTLNPHRHRMEFGVLLEVLLAFDAENPNFLREGVYFR
jgi:hypothetical protein